jgi:hypothetical protein
MPWDARTTRQILLDIEAKVDRLYYINSYEIDLEEMQMASLDETLAKVTEANTKADSLIALTAGIKAQLDEALKDVNLTAEQQAKVDAIFGEAAASVDEIDAAIAANTPPTPSGA